MKSFFILLTTAAGVFAAPAFTQLPEAFRDASPASPSDLSTDWWRAFGDPVLDARIGRALEANRDVRAALARVEQARAAVGASRADFFPALTAAGTAARARTSESVTNAAPERLTTTYKAQAGLSWEIDLFGRVRRQTEGAQADLAAAGATYDAARLVLASEVAATHFTMRALDLETGVVTRTIAVRRDALNLVQARYRQGGATGLDVARAETELATTEADAVALANQRSATQNALAVLLGEAAPAFAAEPEALLGANPPEVPPGLPSDLLLRRPDLAAASHRLAAANARIGVAKAAFFPSISLTGAAGSASADLDTLFNHGSRLWSIGPSVYVPLFQGGRNRANLARSRAVYEETLAVYEHLVLNAFREVQDALTAARLLAEQEQAQARAAASARRSAALSQTRFDAGFVSYLEVVDTERTALEAERAAAQLAGRRWVNHVTLIKALGGGWSPPSA